MRSIYDEIREILNNYKEQLPQPEKEREVKRALLIIQQHLFDEILDIEWLKSQCYIKGKSFPVRFKMYTGRYPKEYIIHHRIEASKLLLRRTEIFISQVAISVGFSSLASFCNTFRNREEIRPSQYREKHKREYPEIKG